MRKGVPSRDIQGVLKKACDVSNCHNSFKNGTRNKSRVSLKSSGSPLTDGHWNFLVSTFGAWENGV